MRHEPPPRHLTSKPTPEGGFWFALVFCSAVTLTILVVLFTYW